MKIIIAGDTVPTPSNEDLFIHSKAKDLVGEQLYDILRKSDHVICNLETPLVDDISTPIIKNGPNLHSSRKTVAALKALNIDITSLANNHIMDYGYSGLMSTIDTLSNCGIQFVGVGEDTSNIKKSILLSNNNVTIGLYACTENEFSQAKTDESGANPFDVLSSFDDVMLLKEKCDYVIVLYHGGKEYYRYPSPNLQKYCRKFIDKGADIVICQHSHCIGCYEQYHEGHIIYGQGNFLFDRVNNEFWNEGLLIEITVETDRKEVKYIPFIKENGVIRKADKHKEEEILTSFYHRSNQINDNRFVEDNYSEFARRKIGDYLTDLYGKESLLFRGINKLLGNFLRINRIKRKYNAKQIMKIQNYVQCEAHRELLIKGLQEYININKRSSEDE